VGRWRLAGMAVGWNEVNDLEVMRVGRLKLVALTEVRGLSVATVGTGRVDGGFDCGEWASCGDSRKLQGLVHLSLLAFDFQTT